MKGDDDVPLTGGSRLGPYEIVAPLGAGGMGEVYRARDPKLNRDVAIKVLLPTVANDPDRLARFSREAQVLASLNHPNIAAIYGIEESNGVTALVMELVEGEDLSQRIGRGAIPIDEALPIARQIAEALEAAHDHGIIHRDLKPANIKVRPDGTVKVLDFGLAKAVDPTAGSSTTAMNSPTLSIHATQAGIILGTAAYMSPEQARGKAVDKRTDLWALGCVLFEMLTGTRAFPGDDATDTIVAVVSKEPDWQALPPSVPSGLRKLLRRCLEKDPKRRLDSAAVIRIEIDDVAQAPSADAPVSPRPLSRFLPWGVAATLAAGLLASVMYPRRVPEERGVVRFNVESEFGSTRRQGAFAVSPDGRSMAFTSAGADGVGRIVTRRLDDVETQVVTGTETAVSVFWSPDSRSIGFVKRGAIFRTDLDGRPPLRLCDLPGGPQTGSVGAWGTKGVIVFSSSIGLMRVADTGGTPTPVSALNAANSEVVHTAPFFLPNGIHVLFLALAPSSTSGVIWATSIDEPARTRVAESSGGAAYADGWLLTTTGSPRRLLAQPFDPQRLTTSGSPQPVRDRLGFASTGGAPGFSLSANGVLVVDRPPPAIHQLAWMDRRGQVLSTIGPAAAIRDFALAPDERRVAAPVHDIETGKADLWLYDSGREGGTRLTVQSVVIRPMWARDGRRIFFKVIPMELRSLIPGATESQPFDNPGGFAHFEDLTRDGRYFLLKAALNLDPTCRRA